MVSHYEDFRDRVSRVGRILVSYCDSVYVCRLFTGKHVLISPLSVFLALLRAFGGSVLSLLHFRPLLSRHLHSKSTCREHGRCPEYDDIEGQ